MTIAYYLFVVLLFLLVAAALLVNRAAIALSDKLLADLEEAAGEHRQLRVKLRHAVRAAYQYRAERDEVIDRLVEARGRHVWGEGRSR